MATQGRDKIEWEMYNLHGQHGKHFHAHETTRQTKSQRTQSVPWAEGPHWEGRYLASLGACDRRTSSMDSRTRWFPGEAIIAGPAESRMPSGSKVVQDHGCTARDNWPELAQPTPRMRIAPAGHASLAAAQADRLWLCLQASGYPPDSIWMLFVTLQPAYVLCMGWMYGCMGEDIREGTEGGGLLTGFNLRGEPSMFITLSQPVQLPPLRPGFDAMLHEPGWRNGGPTLQRTKQTAASMYLFIDRWPSVQSVCRCPFLPAFFPFYLKAARFAHACAP